MHNKQVYSFYIFSKSIISMIFLTLLLMTTSHLQSQNVPSQVVTEEEALEELKKRDIDPEVLREKLLEKGIDMDNLKNLDASEALNIQSIIEETISEIQAEKETKKNIDKKEQQPVKTKINKKQDNPTPPVVSKKEEFIKKLPIYGQELFVNQHIEVYNSTTNIKAKTSYVLGSGDEISVSIWGLSTLDNVFTISESGYISPTRMPRIYLRGVKLEKAKSILRNRFAQYYRFNREEFEVALNTSRSIQVNIFGEVANYGGFTLPATNTAFNAIVAAGGPTEIGSVRNIKLIRGKETKILDVYKWMKNPMIAEDYYLQHNDFIQIPKAERIVSINGQIQRSMQYELTPNEHLINLIEYAGGLKASAYLKQIKVQRYEGEKQILLDIPWAELSKSGQDFILQNGDEIFVDSITVTNENLITVEGAVAYPGNFAWRPNLKLNELLKLVVFSPDVNSNLAFVQRMNADSSYNFIRVSLKDVLESPTSKDNILLQKKDKLIVLELQNNTKSATVQIKGAVSNPSIYPYDQNGNIRVSDLILISGGLKEDAMKYGYIERRDPEDLGTNIYIRIDVASAVSQPHSSQDQVLSPFDVLIIDSKSRFVETAHFQIMGASNNPGQYKYVKNLTLKEALIMAGGLTKSAAAHRIDIFRISMKNDKSIKTIAASVEVDRDLNNMSENKDYIQPYDQIVIRNMPEFEYQKLVRVEGEVKYPGPYALTLPNEQLSSIIIKAGGLTRESFPEGATLTRYEDSLGYIVINLNEALYNKKSRYNIILKEGDQLYIPKQKDLVGIEGATNASDLYHDEVLSRRNRISVPFHRNKNAMYYVKEYAAGVSKKGDKKYITVQHPNGHIEYTKNYFFFKRYPKVRKGSIVQVGLKKVKKAKDKGDRTKTDWTKVRQEILIQLTTFATLYALIRK